jgi:hypothetical protein
MDHEFIAALVFSSIVISFQMPGLYQWFVWFCGRNETKTLHNRPSSLYFLIWVILLILPVILCSLSIALARRQDADYLLPYSMTFGLLVLAEWVSTSFLLMMFTDKLQNVMFWTSTLALRSQEQGWPLQRKSARRESTTLYGTIAISILSHLAAAITSMFAPEGIKYKEIGLALTLSLDLALFGHTVWLKKRHYQRKPGPKTAESGMVKTLMWHKVFGSAIAGALLVVIFGCGFQKSDLIQYPFLVSATLPVGSFDNLLTLLRH